MALEGMTPGVIATIIVVAVIALVLLVFYFVCRSDDPARDHTCVALLYPRTRRELQQLRIPLDPINPTDVGVNDGFQPDSEDNKKRNEHSVQVHNTPQSATQTQSNNCVVSLQESGSQETAENACTPNKTTEESTQNEISLQGFDTVELKAAVAD